MTITMYQADRSYVTPANDASLYSALVNDTNGILNRGNNFSMTTNGLAVTVNTGQALVQGRLTEIIVPEIVYLPPNTSGKICLTIDLSKINSVIGEIGTPDYEVKVNQVYLSCVSEDIVQEDLNNGGVIYQLPLASFASTATSAAVTAVKTVFKDTGWIDFTLADNAFYQDGSYARYRVMNNTVFARWCNINCTKTQNGNQVFKIPNSIKPSVAGAYYAAGSNIDINNGNHQFCNYVIPDVANPIGVVYGMWGANQGVDLTGATGSAQWPLGGNV